jgi:hypothetical protein
MRTKTTTCPPVCGGGRNKEINMTDYKQFVKDRDEAFIDFVKTGDTKKVREYCKKYGVVMPRDRKVFAAGIYKAVQECVYIPEDVKTLAMQKCVAIGFNPFIKPYDYDMEGEVTE